MEEFTTYIDVTTVPGHVTAWDEPAPGRIKLTVNINDETGRAEVVESKLCLPNTAA